MVLDASLLNIYHYKVQLKGKVKQSKKYRPPLHLNVVAIEMDTMTRVQIQGETVCISPSANPLGKSRHLIIILVPILIVPTGLFNFDVKTNLEKAKNLNSNLLTFAQILTLYCILLGLYTEVG